MSQYSNLYISISICIGPSDETARAEEVAGAAAPRQLRRPQVHLQALRQVIYLPFNLST